MKIEIIEIRKAIYKIDKSHYEDGLTPAQIVAVERDNHKENYDYMDMVGADTAVTFNIVEE